MTLWAGRVGRALDPAVAAFLRADDAELLPYDCEATAIHAGRLHAAGLLDDEELEEAVSRLAEIARRRDRARRRGRAHGDRAPARRGRPQDPRRPLAQRPGRGCVPALRRRRLRRGARRDRCFAGVVLDRAEADAETPMPGYTHLQRAQPVTVGHHLLAWVEMLERDLGRFGAAAAARARARSASGALAGSTLPLHAPDGQMRNSLDAVADRDFALDYLYAVAVLLRPSLADRRGARASGRRAEFGFARLARGRRHRLVDDAAEAEPGRRRARARQGGHGDRAADRAARDREGPAARLRPRPAGGQGAGLRRAGATSHARSPR